MIIKTQIETIPKESVTNLIDWVIWGNEAKDWKPKNQNYEDNTKGEDTSRLDGE